MAVLTEVMAVTVGLIGLLGALVLWLSRPSLPWLAVGADGLLSVANPADDPVSPTAAGPASSSSKPGR